MELDFPDLGLDRGELVDYQYAWQLQRTIHAQVAAGERAATVLLLQHRPVYTAGRRTEPKDLPFDGSPVVEVDRGGKITWHGPGQLVAYPIITLPSSVKVVDFVRRVEEAMIRCLADAGITAGRVAGRSGAWIAGDSIQPERKIGQVGIRVSARTTLHGISLNVDPEMRYFANMIPCGIADAGVTSMRQELQSELSMPTVAASMTRHLRELLAFLPYRQSPDLDQSQPVAP